jgi:hypothetical protein
VKAFGEFEFAESRLVESLWRVSASVDGLLRPVFRLNRPEMEEDVVPLDCTEGARTEPFRWGAKKEVGHLRIESRSGSHFVAAVDDWDLRWERRISPWGLSGCRVARISSGEVTDTRRR